MKVGRVEGAGSPMVGIQKVPSRQEAESRGMQPPPAGMAISLPWPVRLCFCHHLFPCSWYQQIRTDCYQLIPSKLWAPSRLGWKKDLTHQGSKVKVGSDCRKMENTLLSRPASVEERQFPLRNLEANDFRKSLFSAACMWGKFFSFREVVIRKSLLRILCKYSSCNEEFEVYLFFLYVPPSNN